MMARISTAASRGLLLLAMLMAGSGCTPPPYWIKGLSLPPGAVEVERSENQSRTNKQPDLPINLPFIGKEHSRYLHVSFNSDKSWDEVQAHFRSALIREGFSEQPQLPAGGMGNLGNDPELTKMLDMTRTFEADGGKRMVVITDNSWIVEMMAKYGQSAASLPGNAGVYSLMVMER